MPPFAQLRGDKLFSNFVGALLRLVFVGVFLVIAMSFLGKGKTTPPLPPQAPILQEPATSSDASDYVLVYEWKNYAQKKYHLKTTVKKSDFLAGISTFGLSEKEYLQRLQEEAKKLSLQYGGELSVTQRKEKGTSSYSWKWKGELRSITQDHVNQIVNETLFKEVRGKYYHEHGIAYDENEDIHYPDYAFISGRHRLPLTDFIQTLDAKTAGEDLFQRTDTYLSFVQSIPYEIPPDEEQGRVTFGLYTPSEVVVYRKGDCDSKSLLFATLWGKSKSEEAVLVDVPNHMLIGIRGLHATRKDQTVIRAGGVDYLLCETTAPGWQPGVIDRKTRRDVKEKRAKVWMVSR